MNFETWPCNNANAWLLLQTESSSTKNSNACIRDVTTLQSENSYLAKNSWLSREEAHVCSPKMATGSLKTTDIEISFLQEAEPRPMGLPVVRASSDGCRVRKVSERDHDLTPVKKRRYSAQGELMRSQSFGYPKRASSALPTFTAKYMFKLLVGPICEFDMQDTPVEGTVSASDFPWA